MPDAVTLSLCRNIMGGTNVLVTDATTGIRINVLSYSNRSNARRAIRSGAAIRMALKYT